MPLTGWDGGPIQNVEQGSTWGGQPARAKSVGAWGGSLSGGSASFPSITNGAPSAMGNSALSRFLSKNSYANVLAQTQAKLAATMGQSPTGGDPTAGGASMGMGNPTGGNWNNINRWNSEVAAASAQTGVPANVIKAIMSIESEGNPNALSSQGYYGLMQTGPQSDVPGYMMDRNWLSNPANQVLAGATELMNKYNMMGRTNWGDAARAYLGLGGSDAYGTDQWEYLQRFNNAMAQLNAAGGSSSGSGSQGSYTGGGGALQTMFGGHFSNAFAFNARGGTVDYSYGTAYGMDGIGHPGIDVPQPLGSPLYAPTDAVVSCVACWRNDHITGGVGRIELELPNGTKILYDHSNKSYVQVGQHVTAGTLLGTSGGMNSPHTHLEVRVPDSSTASGYRLVDPVAFFNSGAGGSGGTTKGLFAGNPGQKPQSAVDRAKSIVWGTRF